MESFSYHKRVFHLYYHSCPYTYRNNCVDTRFPSQISTFLLFLGNIASHINDIITSGNIEYSRTKKRGNREGIEKLYSHNGKYYLLTGIGTNGFIVSAYPIDEKEAIKLKEMYKK